MRSKTHFRAGIVALFAGILLFSIVAAGLRPVEWYPGSERELKLVLFWFCASLAGSGVLLAVRSSLLTPSMQAGSHQSLRMFPALILRNEFPLVRHRPATLVAQLPHFGLLCGAVLWMLVFLFMIFPMRATYSGLSVNIRTLPWMEWAKSPWTESLGVYLAKDGRYYINGRVVVREELRQRLGEALGRRAEWTVYFEADYDAVNGEAIFAIDTIQGTGARLVWITPAVREELRWNEGHGGNRVP
jgi:biopolymer transport protein ExbD